MSLYSFCSENINEAVSILGKGVGVTFGSRGLGVLGNGSTLMKYGKYI